MKILTKLIRLFILTSIYFLPINLVADSKILEIPFIKQNKNYCGPASLAIVFNYYDKEISQEEIAKYIYNPELKGTLSIDLLLFVRKHNFTSEIYKSNIQDLKQKINQNNPVIVLTKGNPVKNFSIFKNYHFFVIYGYNDDKQVFYCHSGSEKSAELKYKKLEKPWKETGNCAFLIYPENEN
ncbi:MAG: C39 family peptidase [Candidatus Aureabacteria bacterium]|nr:C39 family peptidase [Candidatus Auribacterota bacterium]